MAAYLISDVTARNAEAFQTYRTRAAASIEQYGGRYLVRGGPIEALEGDWTPRAIIVVEFPPSIGREPGIDRPSTLRRSRSATKRSAAILSSSTASVRLSESRHVPALPSGAREVSEVSGTLFGWSAPVG